MHKAFREGFEKTANFGGWMMNNPRLAGTLSHGIPGALMGAAGGAFGGAALSMPGKRDKGAARGAVIGGLTGGAIGGYRGHALGKMLGEALEKEHGKGYQVGDANFKAIKALLNPQDALKVNSVLSGVGGTVAGTGLGVGTLLSRKDR